MDYDQIVKLLCDFRDQRGWQKYHNLKDLAISLNLEASEVLEIFQWQPSDQQLSPEQRQHLQEELADTMIYLIYMFNQLGVDPGDAIQQKVAKNQHRHWPKIDQQAGLNQIKVVRIYDHQQPQGYRMLVDRLWPRGMSKVRAALDEWDKEIAPSNDLRKRFGHDPAKFAQFQHDYCQELDNNSKTQDFVQKVRSQLQHEDVIFLYGAKDRQHNQAVVLAKYLRRKLNQGE